MGRVVKKEVVTSTQPDGTLLTTTTKTVESGDEYYDEWQCGGGSMNAAYCCTPPAFIRLLQIIFGFIIVGCISGVYGTSYAGVLAGQHFVLILACFAICFTFILLIVFCFGMHLNVLEAMPWRHIDLIYSLIMCFLFLIAGILEAYYASGSWRVNCRRGFKDGRMDNTCPSYTPWIFASVPFLSLPHRGHSGGLLCERLLAGQLSPGLQRRKANYTHTHTHTHRRDKAFA